MRLKSYVSAVGPTVRCLFLSVGICLANHLYLGGSGMWHPQGKLRLPEEEEGVMTVWAKIFSKAQNGSYTLYGLGGSAILMLTVMSVILGLLVWLAYTASLYISSQLSVLSHGVSGKLFYKDVQHKPVLSPRESSVLYTRSSGGFARSLFRRKPCFQCDDSRESSLNTGTTWAFILLLKYLELETLKHIK